MTNQPSPTRIARELRLRLAAYLAPLTALGPAVSAYWRHIHQAHTLVLECSNNKETQNDKRHP